MSKTYLLFTMFLLVNVGLQAQIVATTSTTPVSCQGGNDGSATITNISGGIPFNNSTKGLLISEILTDTTGSDSPFEFVELVATRFIDFSSTPYTIIFCNNNTASASGWIAGGTRSYAFQISTGIVTPGQVVYVGGINMSPLSNQLRVINTATTGGDGGIGNFVVAGVLGNGGVSVDGVAVFNVSAALISPSTVPIDALFFGDAIGAAYISSIAGYQLPINDYYSGGKLDTISYFVDPPSPAVFENKLIKANFGVYNTNTNTFSQPRQWIISPTFTNLSTSILLDGIYNVNWSNACTSVYNPNLTAGPYTFTISDALSSLANGVVNVADGANVNLNATADDSLACEGQAIVLSASNADILIWDNGDTSSSTNASVDFDTTFYVTGIDTLSGCTYTDSVFIDVNQIPTVQLVLAFDSVCNNGGSLVLTGGTPVGGVYSGAGVVAGSLDPVLLAGINQVDYNYADANGCSSMASDNYVVVNCLGIDDEEIPEISLYPNPATDIVWVKTNVEGLNFSIMDLSGKMVMVGNVTSNNKIDIQNITAGLYIITLYNSSIKQQVRLIKK